jgi:hypothetical protein
MKKLVLLITTLAAGAILLTGCAGVSTHRAEKGAPIRGIRVYLPKVYIVVFEPGANGQGSSMLITVPDAENAYDVKPWAFLAKNDFSLKLGEGAISDVSANLDSTAALSLIQKAAELAAAAAEKTLGKGVSQTLMPGAFGLKAGIYTFDAAGNLKVVSVN